MTLDVGGGRTTDTVTCDRRIRDRLFKLSVSAAVAITVTFLLDAAY
jgi:hypothetical protein